MPEGFTILRRLDMERLNSTCQSWAWNRATGFSLSLSTQSGRVYALEYKDSLADNNWVALPLRARTGSLLTLVDPRHYEAALLSGPPLVGWRKLLSGQRLIQDRCRDFERLGAIP